MSNIDKGAVKKELIENLTRRSAEANAAGSAYSDAVNAVLDAVDDQLGSAWRKPSQYFEGKVLTTYNRTDEDVFMSFFHGAALAQTSNPNFPLDTTPKVAAAKFAELADAMVAEFKQRFRKEPPDDQDIGGR